MATLQTTNPTLADWAKSLDPDGSPAAVIEILNQTNEILDDMTWMEGNLPTGNRTTIRNGLPTPTWRKLYGGVIPDKSGRTQVTDTTGMLEAYSEVDVALAKLANNKDAFLLQEAVAHIESMGQEIATTLLFGDEGLDPEEFTGLSPRYNDLSAENADNIIDAGGTGVDNRSIWLVVWGPNQVHGIFPQGSTAGISVFDKGQQTIAVTAGVGGSKYEAFVTHFKWDAGLSVRDWRFAVRIANIDKSLLTADISTGADLPDLMVQAIELIPNMNVGRPSFYMSRDLKSMMRRQLIKATTNSTLTQTSISGRHVTMFDDIPVRRVDALASDEARVV